MSFDICDMYPSLPKNDVMNEVERRINNSSFKTKINKQALIRLARLSVSHMTFKISGKYYVQSDGLFIGSPASPCFAELFIQRIEEINIYKLTHAPRIWLRKVDDTFTITKHKSEDTLAELNGINGKIKFTAEEETDRKIPFLDCLIERTNEMSLKSKVYKKPTHTGQYINYDSNQPLHVKLSTIKTLVRRAKLLCTEKHDFEEELKYIRKTMALNDFPKRIIEKTIREALTENRELNRTNEKEENMISMYLPYEKGISENIQRISKGFNVKVIHKKNKSLKNIVNTPCLTNETPMDQQGVVYKVKCGECEKFYIGETGRKLRTRLREHEKDASSDKKEECISGLSKHAMESKHNIVFDNAEILHKERNFQKRKFKEAIAIKKQSMSLLNKKEEIKTLSNIWENIL